MEDREAVIAAAFAAGVVGAGGAGFPTHIKLDSKSDTFLVNGAECEPLLRVDQLLAREHAEKLMHGLTAAMAATGASKAIIGLKAKYKEAIASVKRVINRQKGIDVDVGELPDIYPAGDEHVLVYELTGRTVPQGGLPLAVGVSVANVETLCNLSDALSGKPVTTTWVTVGGAVARPMTVSVPIGVSMADVVRHAGGPIEPECALIEGGPMMGRLVADWAEPVTKLTKGLLLLPWRSPVVEEKRRTIGEVLARATSACDQCRNCTDLCPRYLLGHDLQPHIILRATNNALPVENLLTQASLCSECGVCSLVACPASLWPRRVNAELRAEFRRQAYPFSAAKPWSPAVRLQRRGRMLPTKRLIHALGLEKWDVPAPLERWTPRDGEVVIPLRQHAGAPSMPVVAPGQTVREGDLVGEASGKVSARVHASRSGVVTKVDGAVLIRGCGA